ncbi:hypothetical protein Tco_1486012, partial [Tanacetum coccineum]
MADERIKSSDDKKLKLKLIGTRKRDGRDYNLPTAFEVAALIIGDFDSTKNKKDIILHCQDGDLMRISELHHSYLAMQYPLFFPYAEDGYRTEIFHYGVTDYDEKNKGTHGPDRVTTAVDGEEVDEIKDFYDCRYLSACEAAWRIYSFDIHYRISPVERLPHLQDEQSVIFDATESIDYTLEKSSVNETKFVQLMELNKTDDFASTLLYAEIPKYYVWNTQKRIWDPRQR